jgi:hypothetical protein
LESHANDAVVMVHVLNGWCHDLHRHKPQASLAAVGIDASSAVARARERSRSRVGRKRARSEAGRDAEAMDVDGTTPAPKKRIHSSKSR